MEYVRIFGDSAGETHFETVELPLPLTDFAPPAPSVGLRGFQPGDTVHVLRSAVGLVWRLASYSAPADVLPAPSRPWEITSSDGEVRRFGPGSALFVEDTAGKGHTTRIVGDEDALAGIVQVPD